MYRNLGHLLTTRRFLPLFITQALGAFNDNSYRYALTLLITYDLAMRYDVRASMLVAVALALFMLPFVLFSAIAGQLADKFEKSMLIRRLKITEMCLVALAAVGFLWGNLWWQLFVLFLFGTQSAFFGPLKYGILPQHLDDDELIGGNALVEMATYLVILLGQLFGGLTILLVYGPEVVAGVLFATALTGYAASRFIPVARAPAPKLRLNFNIVTETWIILRQAARNRSVFFAILGIAWFWLVGAIYLAQLPPFARNILDGGNQVANALLAALTVGIGAGALLCSRLQRGEISAKYVPLGALAISVFSVDLVFAAEAAQRIGIGQFSTAAAFFSHPANWRVAIDLIAVSVGAGLYVVPLYAMVQHRAEPAHRSRIIAGSNVMNAFFVFSGMGATAAALDAGLSILNLFLLVAAANGVLTVFICTLLPTTVRRGIVKSFLRLLYRVTVTGRKNYRKPGKRAVIVANHASTLDPVLLAAFLPDSPIFALDTDLAKKWWLRPILRFLRVEIVDPDNAMVVKHLVGALRQGRKCVIFPEGRPTVTGALMKIHEGPGTVADMADAPIQPVRIDGAEFSRFSLLKGKLRRRLCPKIILNIQPAQRFTIPDSAQGKSKREYIADALYDLMTEMIFESTPQDRTLIEGLIDARAVHGPGKTIARDADDRSLTYNRIIAGSFVMGRQIAALSEPGEHVGVLLPNAIPTVAVFFGAQAYGRIPAMLNFSTGARNMVAACHAAEIKTILTSRRFIEAGQLEEAEEKLGEVARLVYLEDVAAEIGLKDKLRGLLQSKAARLAYRRTGQGARPDDRAVILFTSGSEGSPKGVALSHRNIIANINQVSARVDFTPLDRLFNSLPIFHSFGMLGGLALPLMTGVPTYLYPSPLHYKAIPEAVYRTNSTIMFGTDTFLAGYARNAHPYDFYSLRYIFAGAEKLKRETRELWAEKFGIRVFEGYGVTETSPVLAVNTPMQCKAGTVGRFVPGVDYRIDPVDGIEKGGRLVVKGPNIMLGYLRNDRPGELQPPSDGWYDTGDIVDVDDEGYITIIGRAKRFAKVAGEMVSLTAVEGFIATNWPDNTHAVVSVADAKKGERLVLVTDREKASRSELAASARSEGLSELMVPRDIIVVEEVPVLGTGKIDYVRIQHIAMEEKGAR